MKKTFKLAENLKKRANETDVLSGNSFAFRVPVVIKAENEDMAWDNLFDLLESLGLTDSLEKTELVKNKEQIKNLENSDLLE